MKYVEKEFLVIKILKNLVKTVHLEKNQEYWTL